MASTSRPTVATFDPVKIKGALQEQDLGRTSIAYSSDGRSLYAVVQSASMFKTAVRTPLAGNSPIYVQ